MEGRNGFTFGPLDILSQKPRLTSCFYCTNRIVAAESNVHFSSKFQDHSIRTRGWARSRLIGVGGRAPRWNWYSSKCQFGGSSSVAHGKDSGCRDFLGADAKWCNFFCSGAHFSTFNFWWQGEGKKRTIESK